MLYMSSSQEKKTRDGKTTPSTQYWPVRKFKIVQSHYARTSMRYTNSQIQDYRAVLFGGCLLDRSLSYRNATLFHFQVLCFYFDSHQCGSVPLIAGEMKETQLLSFIFTG